MKPVLIDTGPIVAYLDHSDSHHALVTDGIGGFRQPLVTTGAVITEAMFFLQGIPNGPGALQSLILSAGIAVLETFDNSSLQRASGLMEKYRDVPMDFADATLVVLAEALNAGDILTLDERGFHTYRFNRKQSFTLLLQA